MPFAFGVSWISWISWSTRFLKASKEVIAPTLKARNAAAVIGGQ